MAFVYEARDLRRQRLVAIKVSDPGLAGDDEVVARFRQEQLLAVRLAHPDLVAAYDAGLAPCCGGGCQWELSPKAAPAERPAVPVSRPVQRPMTDYIDFTGRTPTSP
jgi:serine/threonine protein kinase